MHINSKITPEIAEICGVIVGDGHLSRYISSRRTDYRIEIVGNKTEEIEYFKYITKLFYHLFGKDFKLKMESDYARLYIHSKELLEFFENIGLIVGKKSDKSYIPNKILNDEVASLHFLKGLADTDFCICFKKGGRKMNSYPKIVAEFASESLIKDIQVILNRIGITYYKQTVTKNNTFGVFTHYRLELNGRKNLEKWMELIGFSNPKHITKIKVLEKLGYCPPRTTYLERLKILKEE